MREETDKQLRIPKTTKKRKGRVEKERHDMEGKRRKWRKRDTTWKAKGKGR